MAAPADYLDTNDLKALTFGGLVREDVMNKIWNISQIPLPFTDSISAPTVATNSYHEWTTDVLAAAVTTNKQVSGADVAAPYTTATLGGLRVGNHCQNSIKTLALTERAQSTTQVGRAEEMAYQLMLRQQELKRDIEASCLAINASVKDDNNATAGQSASFSPWVVSNDDLGATGSATGFNTGTGVVAAPTPGNQRALSEATLKNVMELAYIAGGNVSILMSTPRMIRSFSEYLLRTAGAKVATISNTYNDGGNNGAEPLVGRGAVSVYATDYGFTLKMVPNRLQPGYTSADATAVVDVDIIDPALVAQSFLKGYTAAPIAKLGLSDRMLISVDWTLEVRNEKGLAVVRDINPLTAVAN